MSGIRISFKASSFITRVLGSLDKYLACAWPASEHSFKTSGGSRLKSEEADETSVFAASASDSFYLVVQVK